MVDENRRELVEGEGVRSSFCWSYFFIVLFISLFVYDYGNCIFNWVRWVELPQTLQNVTKGEEYSVKIKYNMKNKTQLRFYQYGGENMWINNTETDGNFNTFQLQKQYAKTPLWFDTDCWHFCLQGACHRQTGMNFGIDNLNLIVCLNSVGSAICCLAAKPSSSNSSLIK